jgi:hypothetical protein
MTMTKFCFALAGLVAMSATVKPVLADDIEIDFSNVKSAGIAFTGSGAFDFFPTGTNLFNFQVTNTDGLPGTSLGFFGELTNPAGGSFQMGAVSSCGVNCQTASVSGAGGLTIYGGVNGSDTAPDTSVPDFTAQIQWVEINQLGSGVTLNDKLVLDISNISYSGTNADLLDLKNSVDQYGTVSFTLKQGVNLQTLYNASSGPISESFSGQINAMPEPGFYGVLCVGLISLVAVGRRLKSRRERQA